MGLGLNSAFNTASMGIKASEKMINTIGNNLANANTTGFKSERVNFGDMLSYTYSLATPSSETNGGTDPLQIGMGVVTASVTTDFNQGTIKDGMSKTDLAIQGGGFFVVRPNPEQPEQFYTRNGVFNINGDHVLTNADGLYVMGFGINDKFELQTDKLSELRIPINEMKIAEATQNVTVSGLLNAVGDDSTQGSIIQSDQLTDLSVSSPGLESVTASQVPRPSVENSNTGGTSGDTVGGELEEGSYVYRFVYSREGGGLGNETDYSTPTSTIDVGSGENSVTLSNLPLGDVPTDANPPFTDLKIYRAVIGSDGTASEFYSVGEIPLSSIDDPATFTFTDTKSTSEITDPANALNQDRLNGTYEYYVTYTNQNGESRPSNLSGSVTVNNGRVTLSDIPSVEGDNPDAWTGRNIYRSGPDGNLYLVASIPNMDADVSVIDSTPDSKLLENPVLNEAGVGSALPNENSKLLSLGKQLEDGSFVQAFEEGTITLSAKKGSTGFTEQNFEITQDTTVGEYLKFLEQAFGIQSGGEVPADQGELGSTLFGGYQGAKMIDGRISILGNAGVDNSLGFGNVSHTDLNGKTTKIDLGFDTTQEANGESLSTFLTVYDSLGAEVNVRLTMTLESKTDNTTTYRWYADSADNQPAVGNNIGVGSGTITFDSDGKLVDVSNSTISIYRNDLASTSPSVFEFGMDMGSVSALATGKANMNQTSQDGAAAGVLTDYTITDEGKIIGIFDTGATRTLGQILLANFANQDGLAKAGDNLYVQTLNSGNAIIETPNQKNYGKIKQNSIEASNTDIGSELIDMILASTMYRANTKIITTSNEMYDTLLRMV